MAQMARKAKPVLASASEFVIEKNVPIPLGHAAAKYPLREMEIGDSFFVPGIGKASDFSASYMAGKRLGRKFTIRAVEGGIRVWRIA